MKSIRDTYGTMSCRQLISKRFLHDVPARVAKSIVVSTFEHRSPMAFVITERRSSTET